MLFLLSVIFGLAFYFLFLQTRLAKNKLEDRKFKQQSIEIKNDRKGETAIRRNPSSERGLLKVNISGVDTLYKNFQLGVKNYGSSPCLGQRFMQGPFTWLTYNEVNERVTNLGSGMKNKGIKRGENIGIYSINRPEWVIVEQACNAYSFVLVPLYDTLGPNAVEFIINQSGLTTVFVTKDKLELLLKSQPNCPSLKNIVLIDNNTIEDNCNGLINSLKDLEENGKNEPQKHDPPSPDDMATICYTSGTTGDPKGVILLHKNFLAAASGANVSGIEITHADVHISYLPLPHVFERIVQVLMFPNGCRIGFFRGDVRQLFDDILILKPTIFPSVPRLFNRLYDKVTQAIKSTGGIKEKLFNLAFNEKKIYLRKGYFKHPVWDKLVFDKIRARLGGRVRLMITGSAPISSDVLDFLRICFSCDVIEGYGQTEGTAAATTTMLGDTVTGHCGSPNPSVEIKLVDVAEMEYFSTDNPPRGEILVRGPSQFIGYYKNEEQTKSTIEDGWVHTGDIGTFLPNGTLKVIDRKKNIFKLSIGEYVAPEKIENVYNKVDLVAQSFVYGDSLKGSLVAIVVPDEEVIVPYCKKNGIEGSFSELCKNVQIKELISKSLVDAAKEAKLKSFEQVRDIFISSTLFSVDNEILTPTFKLKRPQAYKAYQEQIEKMLSVID